MKTTDDTSCKVRAPRNRTLRCNETEIKELGEQLLTLHAPVALADVSDRIVHQDVFVAAEYLPSAFADLLILDPPYNLTKNFQGEIFSMKNQAVYAAWFSKMLTAIKHTLKPTASVYVCADWKTSIVIAPILEKYFQIKNRITWEREKGRGAKTNWKNNMEDIWFCAVGKEYFFNVDAVKLKRKVLAPYRENGQPKDWCVEPDGNFRFTHPSNLWTDISIPFWSMAENTDHPTQKPEKLIAKLILASSQSGDVVLDPFLGSGTTAVSATKLGRHFVGVESNRDYCCWGVKRLQQASRDNRIQGYANGVFWERNSFVAQPNSTTKQRQQQHALL